MQIPQILVLAFCIYTISGQAQSNEVDVLYAIDTICADTWCEGAEFVFHKVTCFHHAKSCTVFFTIDDEERYCNIADVSTYDNFLDGRDLKSEVYDILTECIHTGDA